MAASREKGYGERVTGLGSAAVLEASKAAVEAAVKAKAEAEKVAARAASAEAEKLAVTCFVLIEWEYWIQF